jgi:predicted extracellular nuclease
MPIQRAVLRSTRAVLAAAAAALAGAFAQPAPDADPLCHADALQVHEVQGPGDDSPVQRRRVLVEGVVSVVMQGDPADPFRRDVGGFWIETPTAARDDDPRTSEGVFVASALPAQVGRRVRVRGTAVESYGATQIGSVFRVADCGPAGPLPPPVEIRLPADRPLGLEPYEGMRVVLPQELVIAEYYNYDRFGEIVLAAPQLGQVRPRSASPTRARPPRPTSAARCASPP